MEVGRGLMYLMRVSISGLSCIVIYYYGEVIREKYVGETRVRGPV